MKINLLPLARQRQPYRYRAILLVALGLLCLAAPVIYYSYMLMESVARLREESAALTTRVDELSPLSPLLQEFAGLEQELRRVKGEAVPAPTKLVPFLDEIARLLPDRVFIDELAINDTQVSLRGLTPTYALAAEFLRVLAGSPLFTNPALSVLLADAEGHRFEITFDFRAGAP